MKRRYLIAASAALLTVVGVTIAQQPPATRPNTPPAFPKPAAVEQIPAFGGPAQLTPLVESNPEELSIEQLLETVKNLRAQKAELEKREQAFMKVLTKKTNKVKEEIDGLNGTVTPVAPPAPAVPTPP